LSTTKRGVVENVNKNGSGRKNCYSGEGGGSACKMMGNARGQTWFVMNRQMAVDEKPDELDGKDSPEVQGLNGPRACREGKESRKGYPLQKEQKTD